MDEKKVLKLIDEVFADPWQVDIQELFEVFLNEPTKLQRICIIPCTLTFRKKDKKILLIVQVL